VVGPAGRLEGDVGSHLARDLDQAPGDLSGVAHEYQRRRHQAPAAAAAASSSNAEDCAPGARCPIARSPRYEARPLCAISGSVDSAPARAASAAARSASPALPPLSTTCWAAAAAGDHASTIVLSPT